jgi:hypothetical protein
MSAGARSLALAAFASLILAAPVARSAEARTPPPIFPVGPATIPVRTEGSVQVEFTQSAAGGCPSCAANGTLSWEPTGDAQLEIEPVGSGARSRLRGLLVFFGGLGEAGPRTTSHVTRTKPDGSTGICSDARTSDLLVLDFSARSPSSLQARLARGAPDDVGIFRTRCGGPIERDLLAALPSATLERSTLVSGRATVDLSGTRQFTAPGVSGTVRSSLRLRLAAPRREPPEPRLPAPRTVSGRAIRTVTATYSLARISGSVETSFRTVAERSVCEPLDACGASGSIRLEPLASSGRATFVAYGSARRTSARGLRAALGLVPGRRPRGVTVLGGAQWEQDAGRAIESFTDGAGTGCSDSVPLPVGFISFWVGPRRAFASFARGADYALDPFRTRCPGPSLVDAAQDHPLATGSVPRAAFRRREVVIQLARGRAFDSEPYRGQTSAALTVVLRRLSVRDRIEPNPTGVF